MLTAEGCTLGPARCCNAPVAAGVSTDGVFVIVLFVLHAIFVEIVSVEAADNIRQKCHVCNQNFGHTFFGNIFLNQLSTLELNNADIKKYEHM